jgi:hypothetical protein
MVLLETDNNEYGKTHRHIHWAYPTAIPKSSVLRLPRRSHRECVERNWKDEGLAERRSILIESKSCVIADQECRCEKWRSGMEYREPVRVGW